MYYTIYETKNKINNNYYIGAHQTLDINDEYLGSGLLIKQAVLKYKKENFEKLVLGVFRSSEIMFWIERMIVDETIVQDRTSYNLCVGGNGGVRGGEKPETVLRRLTPDENGINDYQRSSKKAWETMRIRGTDKIGILKRQKTMKTVQENGLTRIEESAQKLKENWNNKTQDDKDKRNDKITLCWKNKTQDELKSWSNFRSISAKNQFLNETKETKQHRHDKLSTLSKHTISSLNIKTMEYRRVDLDEFMNNPYVTGCSKRNVTVIEIGENTYRFINEYILEIFAKTIGTTSKFIKNRINKNTSIVKYKHLSNMRVFSKPITKNLKMWEI